MKGLIIGNGEVGSSLQDVLSPYHDIYTYDLIKSKSSKTIPNHLDVMHVCLRYDKEWGNTVRNYIEIYSPKLIDICSTVPPGTTSSLGDNAVHSTIRGLHPNLTKSIQTFVKHIGGPVACEVSKYYEMAKIKTIRHATSETTELAHILSNAQYGINLMFADEMSSLCRHYGVDYIETVIDYNKTNNDAYVSLGHKSKCRMILTPPGGKIGGHCVIHGANLIPESIRTPMLMKLSQMGAQ